MCFADYMQSRNLLLNDGPTTGECQPMNAPVVQQPGHPPIQLGDGGANPTPALRQTVAFGPKDLIIRPIPPSVARRMCEQHHYLKSYPGGTLFNFGIFANHTLLGVAVIGVGPFNIHRLFQDAPPKEVVCLSRFWIDDRCGKNSESGVQRPCCWP